MTEPSLQVVPGGDSRRKQTRFALLMIGGVAALGFAAFIVLGLFVFPSFSGSKNSPRIDATRTNLLFVGQAIRGYADEHQGQIPKAEDWMDAIEPHLENRRVLEAPSDTVAATTVSYAMNQNVVGTKLERTATPRILVFEQAGAPARNAVGDPQTQALPRDGLITVLFEDGTVKTLTSEKLAELR